MTTTTVYEFCAKNYKKTGGLKKTATPIMSQTISSHLDGKYHAVEDAKCAAKAIKKALPAFTAVESPYVFSHIRIEAEGKTYIVYQTVRIAGTDLVTSPTELLAALKS